MLEDSIISMQESPSPFLYRLLKRCEIMADYIVDCGLTMPAWAAESLSKVELKASKIQLPENAGDEEIIDFEVKVSEEIKGSVNELIKVYAALSEITLPATPLSIEYTIPTVSLFGGGAKTIPLLRNMWIISFLFLLGFVFSGLKIIAEPNAAMQLSLFFSAGLGAYFYALYTANKYVINRTFDPKYVTFYYNRIIIGIIAGFILANIIDINSADDAVNKEGKAAILGEMTKPILALLGGFSADAVIKILNRVVSMLTTLVQGDVKDIVETRSAELKNDFDKKIIKMKLDTASELYPVFDEIKDKLSAEESKKISRIITGLFGKTVPG